MSRSDPILRATSTREIEVDEHEDAGLGIQADERDQADPDRDRQVVVEE